MHPSASYSYASSHRSNAAMGDLPTMPESPARASVRTLHVTPRHDLTTDWEGVASSRRREVPPSQQHSAVPGSSSVSARGYPATQTSVLSRSGSPSVSILRPAADSAKQSARRLVESAPSSSVKDTQQHLLDHQAFLEWRREEYKKRLEAEARGETYAERRPYSDSFVKTLPGAGNNNLISIDFVSRSKKLFHQPQVLGTKEEIAWLQPPQIPLPVGWNGFWDLCAGHELILQVMAVSGATPDNSPSLTSHFMYPELISCFQRLQYGAYAIHYTPSESPHERYFYIKPLPLGNKNQYCPFLCWSVHRHSHQAQDAIPLCNVMWVTQGIWSNNLAKYHLGGDYIAGPFVGKRRAEVLAHGVFTIWVYDGRETKGVDICATDPLVFSMFMKLFDDIAQLNAALDITGSVRALQHDIERMREEGTLVERGNSKKSKTSILS